MGTSRKAGAGPPKWKLIFSQVKVIFFASPSTRIQTPSTFLSSSLEQFAIMHLIRRAAFRAASSSPSTCLLSKSRAINTSSSFLLRPNAQVTRISPSAFRRFASDDASTPQSADGQHEQSSVSSAVESAAESASTYASEAAESISSTAEEVKDTVADAAIGTAAAAGIASQSSPARSPNSRNHVGAPMNLTPNPSIYVGNLLFDITAGDLQREFGSFGPVKSAVIATDARGMSKGFGYVEFENVEAATAAIEAKHQTIFEGRRLIVNYMTRTRRQSQQNPPSKTLFIGNLAFEMSDADLNKLFRDIRNVLDVRVAIDRRTGQPRGFAHADFVDVESATKALEVLDNQEIYGRKLRCDFSLGAREKASQASQRGSSDGSDGSNF